MSISLSWRAMTTMDCPSIAASPVVYGGESDEKKLLARFNGLKIRRFKPGIGKDVQTPFLITGNLYHAVNGVASCRETRVRKRRIL